MNTDPLLMIGADPEIFLEDASKTVVSGHEVIRGTKERPISIFGGNSIQLDGVAVEFNVIPSATSKDFRENINLCLKHLERRAKTRGLVFSKKIYNRFSHPSWEKLPGFVKMLGCSPDFNAYTMTFNEPPDPTTTARCVGGHVHLGWTDGEEVLDSDHFLKCVEITKTLDEILYPYVSGLDGRSKRYRETLYGGKGSFRPKHYGLEYRSPSNRWVFERDGPETVFDICMDVLEEAGVV